MAAVAAIDNHDLSMKNEEVVEHLVNGSACESRGREWEVGGK